MRFFIDNLMQESRYETGIPTLAAAAVDQGHSVTISGYIPVKQGFVTEPGRHDEEPFLVYGSVQFCKLYEKYYGRSGIPGLYFNKNVKSFVNFAVHIGTDLLNEGYILLPYKEVKRRAKSLFPFFIKPESGLKEFVGQVVRSFADFDLLCPWSHIDDETICVISSPKNILGEFRYVIVNNEVITGSEYRWDDILDVRRDTLPECDKMAEKIAKAEWQADTVYVCDVAMTPEGPKVIELNAFSSSGLYACDTELIVYAVAKAAEHEYNESRE